MRASDKEQRVIKELYTEIFKNATPSADYDNLIEKGRLGELPNDWFMAYEIDQELMDSIMDNVLSKNRIPKWARQIYKRTILLGHSPKYSVIGENID